MPKKTQKHYKKRGHCKNRYLDAKRGTQLKCRMKTCRANKYKSVYGSNGGSIRSNLNVFSF